MNVLRWRVWTRNLSAKILSFFFAIALWFSVTNQIDFEEDVVFPIEYVNRPEGLTSIQALPDEVKCKIRGKGRFLRFSLRGAVCRIDLSGNQAGVNTITVSGENLVLPSDARVARVEVLEPQRILAELDETVIRDIPITPAVVGVPAARHVQVGKTFVNPPAARVKGPRKLVDQVALVSTDEIDISGDRNTVRKKVKLLESFGPTVEITPETVEIGITIEPVQLGSIDRVVVEVAGPVPDGWTARVRPESVTVRVSGARSFVEVAQGQVSRLLLSSDAWKLGANDLSLRRIDGSQLVFGSSAPAGPDTGAARGVESVGRAVFGELAHLPDLEIVGIEPDRFLVTFQRARGGRDLLDAAPDEPGVSGSP